MARGVNKVILLGNLGADPEVKYLPTGDAVATVSVATSNAWKDKKTGEAKEQTEWHRVVFYKRLAEIAGEYLRKGAKVYIEGTLRTRKWTDGKSVDHYMTEIIARDLQMLGSKQGGGSAPQGAAPRNEPAGDFGGGDDFDDDIPF